MPASAAGSGTVTSADNEVVRRLRRLRRRREAGRVLIEGPRVVREAVAAGVELELLALREGERWDLPAERVVVLSERVFDAVSATVSPQGVLAIGRREPVSIGEALAAARAVGWPLPVLDGIQDPGNVGAIVRSAAAAGAPAVALLDGSADALGPKAVRASAGNVFHLRVGEGTWDDLGGLGGFAAVATGGTAFTATDLGGADLLVLGGEVRGVRGEHLARVTIPMAAGVESLNVAAAAAVLLFEVRRRMGA